MACLQHARTSQRNPTCLYKKVISLPTIGHFVGKISQKMGPKTANFQTKFQPAKQFCFCIQTPWLASVVSKAPQNHKPPPLYGVYFFHHALMFFLPRGITLLQALSIVYLWWRVHKSLSSHGRSCERKIHAHRNNGNKNRRQDASYFKKTYLKTSQFQACKTPFSSRTPARTDHHLCRLGRQLVICRYFLTQHNMCFARYIYWPRKYTVSPVSTTCVLLHKHALTSRHIRCDITSLRIRVTLYHIVMSHQYTSASLTSVVRVTTFDVSSLGHIVIWKFRLRA